MPSSGWALQKAVFEALSADVDLTALIGADKIFDDVPRNAEYPYVTFGLSQLRDWETGTETGQEHLFSLHVWSRENGRKEVYETLGLLQSVLHDASLTLEGYRLINIRYEFSEARRETDGETYRGLVRFRATTEPITG